MLRDSWIEIESMILRGKKLLDDVRKSSSNIENISYNDTLNEIEGVSTVSVIAHKGDAVY